jgi:hypothetical protein
MIYKTLYRKLKFEQHEPKKFGHALFYFIFQLTVPLRYVFIFKLTVPPYYVFIFQLTFPPLNLVAAVFIIRIVQNI